MASNVGAIISSFMQSEGKKIMKQQAQAGLRQAASGLANVAVGGLGGGRPQQSQVRSRTNLVGAGMVAGLGPTGVVPYVAGKMAVGKVQKAVTSAAAFSAKGATPEAGAALQGSVELAKNQINAFTNLFTAPGIKSISDFFNVLADSPNQIMSFGEALLSVTGRLREVSTTFAKIGASREIRQLERDIKTGQQTGESATRLNESIEELKDEMLPIQNDLYNTTADLVTELVPLVQDIYRELAPWLKASLIVVTEILRWAFSVVGPLLIAMLTVFEKMLAMLSLLVSSWNPIFRQMGFLALKAYIEIKLTRKAIEDMDDEDGKEDPHRLAVQALFGKVGSITNPPKPPPKKP